MVYRIHEHMLRKMSDGNRIYRLSTPRMRGEPKRDGENGHVLRAEGFLRCDSSLGFERYVIDMGHSKYSIEDSDMLQRLEESGQWGHMRTVVLDQQDD